MEITSFEDLPMDKLLTLRENCKKCFASVYINEKKIDIIKRINEIKYFDFRYYKYILSSEVMTSDEKWSLLYLQLTKIPSQEKNEPSKGAFFILEDKVNNLYYIFSSNSRVYIDRVIHSFFKDYFYPDISRAFLTSKELILILEYLEENIGQPICGRNSTGKVLFGKSPETIMTFGKGKEIKPFRDHFTKARKDGKWVSWISLETVTDKKNPFYFTLSRQCNIGLNKGNFDYFFKMLQYISQLGLKKRNMLTDREIKKGEEPKPIILEYELDVLSDKINREKLISQVEKYPNCSYSIIHGGNPHIYLYVLDRLDQSAFSFRSIGPNKIMITAQLRTNYASLMRFVNYLVETFSEFKEMKEIEERKN